MELTSKKDFLDLFDKIVNPLIPYMRDGGMKVGFTGAVYNEKTACAEGFLRVLWGLVPCAAGKERDYSKLAEIYRKGFKAGTDRSSDTYWGDCTDYDQMFVEMTTIAYAILFAEDIFWTPLDEKTKDNLSQWLYRINGHDMPTNNWQMFKVLVNCALKKVGRKYSSEDMEAAFKMVEGTYKGGGWYTDGYTQRRDYYVSFAIHFYSLIYSAAMGDEDAERCKTFKQRAYDFAQEFIYWFDDNGSSVPYGRSLVYRFAQVSFWSACLIADVKPFDYGVIKGIIVRHLNSWLDCPIFDRSGILTLGYKYPNLLMTEYYNAPGSPYWALKSFAFLMLNSNHPFWSADIKPLPKLDTVKQLKYADMIITRASGNVCLYPTGFFEVNNDLGKMDCKYSKFVYSTKYGFSVSRGSENLEQSAPDSTLAFCVNGNIYVRNIVESGEIKDNSVCSKWSPLQGIEVETKIISSGTNEHIRKHIITSEYDCEVYDCGFAVENCNNDAVQTKGNNQATVSNKGFECTVCGSGGAGYIINACPNTNLLYNRTVIPAVKYEIKQGVSKITTKISYK